jgi:U6 snRNA-associated Sm-like protein LSm1
MVQFFYIYEFHFQDKGKEGNLSLHQVSVDDILDAQRREQEAKQDKEKLLAKALKERGLHYMPDLSHDDMF